MTSLALLSLSMFRLTRTKLNPALASSWAMAYPIPSEPPVTKAHPPSYLSLRLSLLRNKDPKTVNMNRMILTVPMTRKRVNEIVNQEKVPS